MSSGVASLRLSLWVMSDLQWTEQREASGTTLPRERAPDRLLQPEPHPADLLHEELAAAGGAFVVRQDIGDPSVRQEVDQEGLAAQRDHRVEIVPATSRSARWMAATSEMCPRWPDTPKYSASANSGPASTSSSTSSGRPWWARTVAVRASPRRAATFTVRAPMLMPTNDIAPR